MHPDDLKEQVERILRWEPSSHWRLRDFATLSEQILARTNCWVEAHDLQAFWRSSVAMPGASTGAPERPGESTPGESTPGLLDALAQFADYADWDDFCDRNQVGEMVPTQADFFHAPLWEIPTRWVVVIGWLAVGASAAVALLLVYKR